MASACGVDFGTSNSTVGWFQPGLSGLNTAVANVYGPAPDVLADSRIASPAGSGPASSLLTLEEGKPTLPSVVFFNAEDDSISYGRAALTTYLAGYEGRLMRSMKSLLGTSMMDGQTEVQGRALPFRQLLAYFIGELKRRGEQQAGQSFEHAVFGRPVHFVDDDLEADQLAQTTLGEIAQSVGFKDVSFQFEPIAAAFDYESRIGGEELVLICDIGGGTSDFSLVRLSPERANLLDRRADILGNGGVHIGGTDFDKYLSLGHLMPLLGLGGRLGNQAEVPSRYYFNLATWHTINLNYTQKIWRELQDVYRDVSSADLRQRFERLLHLISERDGHWLALKAEEGKISLSDLAAIDLPLERLKSKGGGACALHLDQAGFLQSVSHLIAQVEQAVAKVLSDAGLQASQIDTVFFTGGSSGVCGLRQRLGALLPDAKKVEGDLFGSIGTGLALDAYRKYR